MKRFYFTLRHARTGKEYYKTVVARNLAAAVNLVTKYYPHFIQVAVREL